MQHIPFPLATSRKRLSAMIKSSFRIAACFGTVTITCLPVALADTSDRKILGIPLSDDFVAQQVETTLSVQMEARCGKLFSGNSVDTTSCQNASRRFATLLDFSFQSQSEGFSFVFMASDLEKIVNSENGKRYLSTLEDKLAMAAYAEKPFNLFSWTVDFHHGNVREAVRYMATLLQDSLATQTQVQFLRSKNNSSADTVLGVLEGLNSALSAGTVQLYPAGVKNQQQALYHYYVPFYLANELREGGFSKRMALVVPFLFNTLYEMRKIQEQLHPECVIDTSKGSIALYRDLQEHLNGTLEAFSPKQFPNEMLSIHLGMAGAVAGATGDVLSYHEDTETFTRLFAKAPLSYLRTASFRFLSEKKSSPSGQPQQ